MPAGKSINVLNPRPDMLKDTHSDNTPTLSDHVLLRHELNHVYILERKTIL